MAFNDLFSFLFQRSTQEERVAAVRHPRARPRPLAARDPRGQVRRQPAPVARAARAPTRPPRDHPRGRRRHGRGDQGISPGLRGRTKPPGRARSTASSRQRETALGEGPSRDGTGEGWDAPSHRRRSGASPLPRSGDSRSRLRTRSAAPRTDRPRCGIRAAPRSQAGRGRAARSRGATWRSSRSTFPGRSSRNG